MSIRNTFVDLIDHAIVKSKTIAPVPSIVSGGSGTGVEIPQIKKQNTQSNKKRRLQQGLDDLDDDMLLLCKTNKAILRNMLKRKLKKKIIMWMNLQLTSPITGKAGEAASGNVND